VEVGFNDPTNAQAELSRFFHVKIYVTLWIDYCSFAAIVNQVGSVGEACEIEPFDFHFVLRSRASADLGFNGAYFG